MPRRDIFGNGHRCCKSTARKSTDEWCPHNVSTKIPESEIFMRHDHMSVDNLLLSGPQHQKVILYRLINYATDKNQCEGNPNPK